jgi:hypothetical protein
MRPQSRALPPPERAAGGGEAEEEEEEVHPFLVVHPDSSHNRVPQRSSSTPPPAPLAPCQVGFGGWTTVYATSWLRQSEADGHALTAAYWTAFTAGRVAASAAAAALRPGPLLLASMPLALVGAGAALAVPSARLAGAPATTAVVLVGLGLSTGFANLLSLLEAYAPINGSVTGLLGGCAGAGTMLMPLVSPAGAGARQPLGRAWRASPGCGLCHVVAPVPHNPWRRPGLVPD